jgi:predicted nucleic acid-binding protein
LPSDHPQTFRKSRRVSYNLYHCQFILGQFIKNKQWHKKQMKLPFSAFEIIPVQPSFIAETFKTRFTDLEDGLLYQCALHAKARVIITKDIGDFFDSKLPIVHPYDFINRYNHLLAS